MNINNYSCSNQLFNLNDNYYLIDKIDASQNSFLFLNDHPDDYFNKYKQKYNNKIQYDVKNYIFSDDNIEIIQKRLIYDIYTKYNYVIPFINKKNIINEIQVIYDIYSKKSVININKEINTLNNIIINKLTKSIINNIRTKERYLNDINSPPPVNKLPQYNNNKNTLPSITTTF